MNGQMVGRRAVRTNWAVRRTPEDEKKSLSYEQIYNATPLDNTTVYIGNLNSLTKGKSNFFSDYCTKLRKVSLKT